MSDYKKLIDDLRRCKKTGDHSCEGCSYIEDMKTSFCWLIAMSDAADAIEELQALLGEAENSVERWKDMFLTKHEPKQGEWILCGPVGWPNWKCTVCHGKGRGDYMYCPWCGAKMGVQEIRNDTN